jgi:hypothetical protein
MPLTTVAELRTAGAANADEMLKRCKLIPVDELTISEVLADDIWAEMLDICLRGYFAEENSGFLIAVNQLRKAADANKARVIYDDYIPDGANVTQINIAFATRQALIAAFGADPPPATADPFNKAYEEIVDLTNHDHWAKFTKMVSAVHQQLIAEEDQSPSAADIMADAAIPEAPPSVDADNFDKWNQEALKALKQGESTKFYELGGDRDYVILIEGQVTKLPTPKYLTWARKNVNANGTITMTAKGSVFAKLNDDRGKVTVAGAADMGGVTAAIARFSQKEVVPG